MINQQHHPAKGFLIKTVSAALVLTMLLSMVIIGNVFSVKTSALETYTDGDYSFTVLDDGTAQITKYSGADAELTVPSVLGAAIPVTQIGSRAFENNSDIEAVTLSTGITAIGDRAFYNCVSLRSITLNDGLVNMGSYAFARTGVTAINIPSTVTKGSFPFENCSSLTSVTFDEGIGSLLKGICYHTAVESVEIPEGVTEVPEMAFSNCANLTTVKLPSTLVTIGTSAFESCTALKAIEIPASVKTISSRAFYLDAALASCPLHEGLTTLGTDAFRATAMTSVTIPKTLTSTSFPFRYSAITDVTFADGITELPDRLFYDAGMITDVTIPDTVTKIGNHCFEGTNIESIDIPDNVTTLGQYAFSDCDNLYAVTIGAGVTKLSYYCFSRCDVLQNVVIPDTVTSLETGVFSESGLCYQKLPDTITSIPMSAFRGCKELVEVECSDALTAIGDSTFKGCTSLTALTTAAESPSFYTNSFDDCPNFTDPRFYVFVPGNTGIESSGNIGTDHTLVHFSVRYDIRDDWKEDIRMSRLILNLPADFEIIPSSFAADGFDIDSDAINDAFVDHYRPGTDTYLDITGAQPTGTLRFSAYLNNANTAYNKVTAKATFWYKNDWFNQSLGEVQFTTSKLSLFAPSTVADESINVSGYSVTPDKNVTIHIDHLNADGEVSNTVSYTVTPNSYTGKYTAKGLGILAEGDAAVDEDQFEVRAESGGVVSDKVTFSYIPGAVKVTEAYEVANITNFTAPVGPDSLAGYTNAHDTAVHDITGVFNSGASPVFIINPHAMYQFRIQLENDENISELVLMSHKGDDWKFMQLHYDAATDFWVGEGYFDSNVHEYEFGHYYLPGALNLFYYYGERKDTYRAHYYPELAPSGSDLAASGGEAFYYDSTGKPHGDFGDPGKTISGSVGKAFVHAVTGKWNQTPSDVTVGGLKALWQWGNKNDNLFKTTHHGYAIDDYGNVVFPDDKADMLNRNAENDGRQCNLIDPAGIVYEAVRGNPVVGATATLYKLNEKSGEWEEWNATDFEQQNPLQTNTDGAYAWLTDEGRFKVTVSKEGYETQTSEEFDVPPEKLNLDFSLVDTTTHPTMTVEKVSEPGTYTIHFSKYMKPDTVTTNTISFVGLRDVTITPVYLDEGDAYADTFTVTGTILKKEVKFTVKESAQSYSGVSAEAASVTITEDVVDNRLLGDADSDGKVSVIDATCIQKTLASIPVPYYDEEAANVDNDSKVTVLDATNIQKHLAHISVPYPIGEPMQAAG